MLGLDGLPSAAGRCMNKKLLKAINRQKPPRTGCYYVVLFAVLGVLGIILLAVWVSWHVL